MIAFEKTSKDIPKRINNQNSSKKRFFSKIFSHQKIKSVCLIFFNTFLFSFSLEFIPVEMKQLKKSGF